MSSRRNRPINLPAPYLKRVWLEPSRIPDREAYPFCLPFLNDDFELSFDRSITIIVGENGTGKSTLVEGLAVMAGYDEAGGGKGYDRRSLRPLEAMGGQLSERISRKLVAEDHQWLVLRAESFFSVARYLDEAGEPLRRISCRTRTARVFCASSRNAASARASTSSTSRKSALSPTRQIEFLKLIRRMEKFRPLPDHHGHALADIDGLSQRDVAPADEIRIGASEREGDGSLQSHAGVLRGSGGVCGGGGGGLATAHSSDSEAADKLQSM